MPTSIFIAKLLGPIFVLVGIALLTRTQSFRAILEQFIRSEILLYLAGFFGLLGGLALVLTHNVWIFDWRLIITVIGWITIARAVATILRPQWITTLGYKFLERRAIFVGAAVTNVAIGLVLSYFGYLA